ncbi:hypothetical protein MTsPCn9_10320 [Croceitalea sp. MTPC9]|uniref:hypothetical protein n=1 Tax=unclassified Croceitalea TaxID=2632280 RepID=UPI002B3B61E1|nr:hypothetical protein MTsPCn6_26920 [Croceitalea sp. MTPC6]GMN16096.1 hypothetical protein MTsPCn9_10320 [Croceitalea sp. MTPC9]
MTSRQNKATKKKCIYLDQFAVSDLLAPDSNSLWGSIRALILKKRAEGKLYCPLSHEHFLETAKKRKTDAQRHDQFLTTLSDGFAFKPDLFITSQLISSRLRGNRVTQKTFFYANIDSKMSTDENYIFFDKLANEHKTLIEDAVAGLNKLRAQTRTQKIKGKAKSSFIQASKYIQTQSFIQRLEELMKLERLYIRGDRIGDKEVPNWVDLILEQLLKRHKLKKKEVKRLLLEFKSKGFENIATLNIRTTLLAYLALYSKKESQADHIDIMRISTGLPLSDIMLVDRQRKAELVESGLAAKYNTLIYSGRSNDLKELMEKLEQL